MRPLSALGARGVWLGLPFPVPIGGTVVALLVDYLGSSQEPTTGKGYLSINCLVDFPICVLELALDTKWRSAQDPFQRVPFQVAFEFHVLARCRMGSE